ncbi:hypothetical protein V8E36_001354 [Tilletia maclaganii]
MREVVLPRHLTDASLPSHRSLKRIHAARLKAGSLFEHRSECCWSLPPPSAHNQPADTLVLLFSTTVSSNGIHALSGEVDRSSSAHPRLPHIRSIREYATISSPTVEEPILALPHRSVSAKADRRSRAIDAISLIKRKSCQAGKGSTRKHLSKPTDKSPRYQSSMYAASLTSSLHRQEQMLQFMREISTSSSASIHAAQHTARQQRRAAFDGSDTPFTFPHESYTTTPSPSHH